MTKSKKNKAYPLAVAIAPFLKLQETYLESSQCALLEDRSELTDPEIPIDVELTTRTEIEYDDENALVLVAVDCDAIFISGAEQANAGQLAIIKARFVLEYHLETNGAPTGKKLDKQLAAFGEINGVFNAWPYFREFVQSTTGRMGLSAFTLPTYLAGN